MTNKNVGRAPVDLWPLHTVTPKTCEDSCTQVRKCPLEAAGKEINKWCSRSKPGGCWQTQTPNPQPQGILQLITACKGKLVSSHSLTWVCKPQLRAGPCPGGRLTTQNELTAIFGVFFFSPTDLLLRYFGFCPCVLCLYGISMYFSQHLCAFLVFFSLLLFPPIYLFCLILLFYFILLLFF